MEGQHAAILSDLVGKPVAPAFAEAKTMDQVLAVVKPLLGTMPAAMPQTGRGGPSFALLYGSRFLSE